MIDKVNDSPPASEKHDDKKKKKRSSSIDGPEKDVLESLHKIVSKKRKLDEATSVDVHADSADDPHGVDIKRVIDLSVGEDSSYAQQTSPVKISPPRDLTKRQVQLAQIDDESSCHDFEALAAGANISQQSS